MAPSCAYCGGPAGRSRTCDDCRPGLVDASLEAQGLPLTPPASAMRLLATIRPKAVAS